MQIIGAVIGRAVRWQEQSRQDARPELVEAFGDEGFADRSLDAWAGFVTQPEPVTATVQEVTGAPARSFREWASEHADDFRRRPTAMTLTDDRSG